MGGFAAPSAPRRSRSTFVSLVVLACAGCGGCIIPLPHTRTTWGPISGRVEDASSHTPLSGAVVEAHCADGGHLTSKTGPDGAWCLPEKQRFCWGILFGVALNHSLPHDNCDLERRVRFDVSAPGYSRM